MKHRLLISGIVLYLLISCNTGKQLAKNDSTPPVPVTGLKFLDEYQIPHNLLYNNTVVGGLSGIDYDKKNDRYFIISDDRSFTNPARFYTSKIIINNNKIDTVVFTGVHEMKQPGGTVFPSIKENAQRAADPESIRYNALTNTLTWSSEGDKGMRFGKMIRQDPFIYTMDPEGNFKDSFLLPSNMTVQTDGKGLRNNDVFEGLSFADHYQTLYVSVEAPLYEDGPEASTQYAGAPIRIIQFDTKTKKAVAQFAYLLDAVANKPVPADAFVINGVSEILSIGNNKLLVMERSYSTGVLVNAIKIFIADLNNATDVTEIAGLHTNKNYKPVSKKLLLNLNDLNRYIDNVEGISLGPVLPNGHQSLILIVDNNFDAKEKSQVFLFEIIP